MTLVAEEEDRVVRDAPMLTGTGMYVALREWTAPGRVAAQDDTLAHRGPEAG